jgi:AcrR family transcriptional regulator
VVSTESPRKAGRPSRPLQREQLLAIAREAFAELGYAGASMGEIASRTGIRKSSLFHHFPTKDELYRESIASTVNDIGELIARGATREGAIDHRVEQATHDLQMYLGRHRTAARLLLREFIDASAAVDAAGDLVDVVLRGTVVLLEEGMASKTFTKRDPHQLALTLIGVHFTFFATPTVSARLIGGDVFDEAVVRTRADAVVSHVRAMLRGPA